MISRFRAALALGAIGLLVCVSSVNAASFEKSISINFGADEPDGARSDVTGQAGIVGTVNWNNLDGASGSASDLTVDDQGVASTSAAEVSWSSNNTWASTGRGEDNNTAPEGNDRNLMTGYLDTNATDPSIVSVSGLGSDFTEGEGYAVVLYTKGGVNGRGGQYTITTPSTVKSLAHVDTAAFDGTFVPGGEGDYISFTGLNDAEFTIESLPTTGATARAPLNGIEIVRIPEPSTLVLICMAALGLVVSASRRRIR